MTRYNAICEHVEDGDTFRITTKNWIRLARYYAPEKGKPGYAEAKRLLSSLILNSGIMYEPVSTPYARIVAEVWHDGTNVNDFMIDTSYKK